MHEKQIAKATIPTYGAFVDYCDGNSPLNNSGVIRPLTQHYQWNSPLSAPASGVTFTS